MNRHSRIQCYITLTFPTFPLLFVSTTTRRGRLLFRARPRARYFPLLSFLFLRLYLPARELTERNNLGLWRLERDLYVVERGCVQSKISLFVNETNQNNRIDQAQTFNSRVSWHRIRRTDLLNSTGFRVPHWPSPCPRDLVTTYSTFTVSLPFTSFLTHIVTTYLIFLNSASSVNYYLLYLFFSFSRT